MGFVTPLLLTVRCARATATAWLARRSPITRSTFAPRSCSRCRRRADKLSCHDELQFQIVHQVAELWMKLIEHELLFAADKLREDDSRARDAARWRACAASRSCSWISCRSSTRWRRATT